MTTSFRVDLEIFRGPVDLLLFLVRKHELDVVELPIARITQQYLEYIEVLGQIDVNAVGDFIELASTLIEMKSRLVLPQGGEEAEPLPDPRQELVRQLLEYKRFKDAANLLDERSREWQQRFARLASDLPPRQRNPAEEPIHELEVWDLVSAFGRILKTHDASRGATIVYDETPIHVHMERIYSRLRSDRRVGFFQLFRPGMHKSTLVGLFLAILELVRHYGLKTEQERLFDEIWLVPGEAPLGEIDFAAAHTSKPRPDLKPGEESAPGATTAG